MFMSLRLWFEQKVADLHHYLQRPKRPKLQPGDRILVLFSASPALADPWVPHEFVDWADSPQFCPSCGATYIRPRFAVRSLETQRLIVVSYDPNESCCPPWRATSPRQPWRSLIRRSCSTPHGPS